MTCRYERDSQGRIIARNHAGDPKRPDSHRYEYDSKDRIIACTYAVDPKHQNSYTLKD